MYIAKRIMNTEFGVVGHGDPIRGAEGWKNLSTYLDHGWVEFVSDGVFCPVPNADTVLVLTNPVMNPVMNDRVDQPGSLTCPTCSKVCKSPLGYNSHLRSHKVA